MSRTLQQWLDYQQRVHARGIDLGLERVREVWGRMGAPRIARTVIAVGGTNGKGSTVAFLEAMLRAGGMRVGAYTSPHILRYNERVRIDGMEADDEALIAAFERIEAARAADSQEHVPLTYFEFGTLAAFDLFARENLDVALLEVGLGGRLDAVNILDADAAIVTTVDLDHMEWLGNNREAIGREKAGIFRAGKPAIIGESDPPQSLVEYACAVGARLEVLGQDFGWSPQIDFVKFWRSRRSQANEFSPVLAAGGTSLGFSGDLALQGEFQYRNAAAAIAALDALGDRVTWNVHGMERARYGADFANREFVLLPGRLQQIADSPAVIVDVAHNPQAALQLMLWLESNPIVGDTYAVFGALKDKDIAGIVRALKPPFTQKPLFAHWHLAGLENESPRGVPVGELAQRVREAAPDAAIGEHADVAAALHAARAGAKTNDRILAFGSFFVVGAVMRQLDSHR